MELEPEFMAEVAQHELSELTKIIEEIDEKKIALDAQRKRMEALANIFSKCQDSPLFWMGGEPTVVPSFIDDKAEDAPAEVEEESTESKSG